MNIVTQENIVKLVKQARQERIERIEKQTNIARKNQGYSNDWTFLDFYSDILF